MICFRNACKMAKILYIEDWILMDPLKQSFFRLLLPPMAFGTFLMISFCDARETPNHQQISCRKVAKYATKTPLKKTIFAFVQVFPSCVHLLIICLWDASKKAQIIYIYICIYIVIHLFEFICIYRVFDPLKQSFFQLLLPPTYDMLLGRLRNRESPPNFVPERQQNN